MPHPQQLEITLTFSLDLLKEARKRLGRRELTGDALLFNKLSGETSGRLHCPFCMYEGRTAKIFHDGSFKCFCCGKFGRVGNV